MTVCFGWPPHSVHCTVVKSSQSYAFVYHFGVYFQRVSVRCYICISNYFRYSNNDNRARILLSYSNIRTADYSPNFTWIHNYVYVQIQTVIVRKPVSFLMPVVRAVCSFRSRVGADHIRTPRCPHRDVLVWFAHGSESAISVCEKGLS